MFAAAVGLIIAFLFSHGLGSVEDNQTDIQAAYGNFFYSNYNYGIPNEESLPVEDTHKRSFDSNWGFPPNPRNNFDLFRDRKPEEFGNRRRFRKPRFFPRYRRPVFPRFPMRFPSTRLPFFFPMPYYYYNHN